MSTMGIGPNLREFSFTARSRLIFLDCSLRLLGNLKVLGVDPVIGQKSRKHGSSMLDVLIRSLPGDHGLPLQQALPDVPPAMADAVNRRSENLVNMTIWTPWETEAKEVCNSLGMDSRILRPEISNDLDLLVDVITLGWLQTWDQNFCHNTGTVAPEQEQTNRKAKDSFLNRYRAIAN